MTADLSSSNGEDRATNVLRIDLIGNFHDGNGLMTQTFFHLSGSVISVVNVML